MIEFEKVLFNDSALGPSGTFIKVGDLLRSANASQLGICTGITMETPADNVIRICGTNGELYVNISSFLRGWPINAIKPALAVVPVVVQPVQNQQEQVKEKAKRKKKEDPFSNALK